MCDNAGKIDGQHSLSLARIQFMKWGCPATIESLLSSDGGGETITSVGSSYEDYDGGLDFASLMRLISLVA